MFNFKYKWFIILNVVLLSPVMAFESFVIKEIRLEGARRIPAGTVFNYLPVTIGSRFSKDEAGIAISTLFKTGFFKDVRLERDGNILIVRVEERPAISKITFEGNSDIETEELTQALKNIGFAEGRVFNRSKLEKVELELQRQYFNLSKYAAQIKSTVTPLDRNRVAIQIDISEGAAARIKQINLVGNKTISDEDLLDEMKLNTGGWFSFLTNSDQYSSLQLAADKEALHSYYLDRGYINSNIDSIQVSISPEKKDVYITINLTEGNKYTVSEVKVTLVDKLLHHLVVTETELLQKVTLKTGSVFSHKELSKSREAILERIGEEGYYFANIKPVPQVNEDKKTVSLNFAVEPGKRTYVRQINFFGNNKTRDEVLRREMRQMEGSWISTKDVKRSLTRLQRLSYFEDVSIETPRVPGTSDQVDINYTVVERPSGNLLAGVGYSQTGGVLFNASIEQDNVFGSGKRVGVTFNNSQISTIYRFSYYDPFSTIDGVSRGFNIFYRSTDAEQANLSRYTTDAYGTSLNYGLPISEFNRIRIGGDFENLKLNPTTVSADEVFEFIDNYGNEYNFFRLTGSWRSDTRNRALFPDHGMLQSVYTEIALPFSDLSYYKVSYRQQWLYPLAKDYILLLKGQVGYGEGYGDNEDLPFFKNYTAGGPRTVRGFRENTLGPLDSNRRVLGGNLKVIGNAEIILPLPFTKKARSFRVSTFLDGGNVFGLNENFDTSELRYSTGLSAIWFSPIGLLSFSFAKPLKSQKGDQIEMFQFTIGTTFNW